MCNFYIHSGAKNEQKAVAFENEPRKFQMVVEVPYGAFGHFGYICLPFVVTFVTTDYMAMEITKILVLEKSNLKKAKNRIK